MRPEPAPGLHRLAGSDGLLSTDARTTTLAASGGDPSPAWQAANKSETGSVPGWLEPTGERERWRSELWSSVTALAERYPSVFSKLIADWWTDKALVEILGALSAWRGQLDAGESPDPRAELLFHDRLELLERRLTQTSDPTARRFTNGPPPSDWLT